MKVLSLVKLIACIMVSLVIMLLAACGGVTVTPNGDGGVTVTPNENEGGNNAGGSSTPDTGNKDENVIHSHTYKLDTSTTGYSCTEGGVRTWKCACGESFNETIEAPGHNIRTYEGKAATCETDGYEPYEKCINGNCDYTTYKVVPAIGHDLQHHADVQPTCTTAGVTDKAVCNRDGCNYSTETKVPALGHLRQTIEGKAATCTQSGYYTYEICTRAGCNGEGISNPVTIDALGHDNLSYEGKEPTCTASGWYAYTVCQRCSHSTYTQRPATGHTYVNGYCSVCNHGDPGRHTHVWNSGEVITSATCTSAGEMKYTCTDSHCGDTKTEVIPTLGHDNKSYSAKAATCTAEGWYAYTECQRCGYSTFASIPALGHIYEISTVTKNPTCTETGVRTYTCVRCEKNLDVTIDALGHSYGDEFVNVEAECEKAGELMRICKNDSSHKETKPILATGHNWGEWVTVKESTCVVNGSRERECSKCHSKERRNDLSLVDHKVSSDGICTVCKQQIWERLETPTATHNGSMLHWGIVENAEKYEILISPIVEGLENPLYTTGIAIDLKDYFVGSDTIYVSLKAIAPVGSGYGNSEYLNYEFKIEQGDILTYEGIGKSVNLITGSYTDFDPEKSIFNLVLFNTLNAAPKTVANHKTTVYYSDNIEEYTNKLTESISNKISTSLSVGNDKVAKVTGGYSYKVEDTYEKKTYNKTQTIFYNMEYRYRGEEVAIQGNNLISTLSAILAKEFLEDAEALQNPELTEQQKIDAAKQFIEKYGTHIITEAVYGAGFNARYEMLGSKDSIENTFGTNTEAEITGKIQATLSGVEFESEVKDTASFDTKIFTGVVSSTITSKFIAEAFGGSAANMVMTSLDGFSDACESWANTIKDDEKYVLVDVPDGSLYFVWDFLGDDYAVAKDILNEYFLFACGKQYDAINAKVRDMYKDIYEFDADTGTLTIDFSDCQNLDGASLEGIKETLNGREVYESSKHVFTVYPKYNFENIKKVVFKGAYQTEIKEGEHIDSRFKDFCIKFDDDWKEDIVIEFENFAYEAPAGYAGLDFSEVESKKITIIMNGASKIIGGNGITYVDEKNGQSTECFNGFEGIRASNQNLIFTGSGEIEIIGGKGINGGSNVEVVYYNSSGSKITEIYTHYDGAKGGAGVKCLSMTVNTDGLIWIYGGDGSSAYDRPSGDNDGDGNNGKNGFAGGNGGVAIEAIDINVQSGTLDIKGGNGGEGGNGSECNWGGNNVKGGKGGDGGDGAVAISSSTFVVLNTEKVCSINVAGGSGGKTGKRGGCHNNEHGTGWLEPGQAYDGDNGIAGSGGSAFSQNCVITDVYNIIESAQGSKGIVDSSLNQC